jgi:hypothetical protein
MIRQATLALVLLSACGACGSSKSKDTKQDPSPSTGSLDTKVEVPGSKGAAAPPITGNAPPVDDPKKHLSAEEGTLDVGKAEGKAGAEAIAKVTVTPASGYHISQEYPVSLKLDPPAGVKLAKADLDKNDVATLSEKSLAFAVKATADKPGAYEIKGWFRFGVCDPSSCHPKSQPITISVAAN